MVKLQWLAPRSAALTPCLFNHFTGQPRRVGHDNMMMVTAQRLVPVHRAVFRNHDPFRVFDSVFVADTVQCFDGIGKIPVGTLQITGRRVVFFVVGVCNGIVTGSEVPICQQFQIPTALAQIIRFLGNAGGKLFLFPGAGLVLLLCHLEEVHLHRGGRGIIHTADKFLFPNSKAAGHILHVLLSANVMEFS